MPKAAQLVGNRVEAQTQVYLAPGLALLDPVLFSLLHILLCRCFSMLVPPQVTPQDWGAILCFFHVLVIHHVMETCFGHMILLQRLALAIWGGPYLGCTQEVSSFLQSNLRLQRAFSDLVMGEVRGGKRETGVKKIPVPNVEMQES